MKKLLIKIKEILGLTDYCPKHKTPYKYHGFYDQRCCFKCWDEMLEVMQRKGARYA